MKDKSKEQSTLNFKSLTSTCVSFTKLAPVKMKSVVRLAPIAIVLAACAAFSGRETMGQYVDDATITTSVKSRILEDPDLKMFQIHVETFQNQVQLSGFVDSSKEMARAGQVARSVEGVQDVKNNLVVRKKGPRTGKAI
ncbi:MAG: osmY 1 [Alphaproteobacteria bacterium]|jgi:hypothetical protein|nr:osmY 1 [Alphaproteobacteria bacterium]